MPFNITPKVDTSPGNDIIKTTSSLSHYIDVVNGNDSNSGASAAPLQTMQRAMVLQPDFLQNDCYVYVKAGTYEETLEIAKQNLTAQTNYNFLYFIAEETVLVDTTAASSGTVSTITVAPDPGWVVNAYVDKFVLLTAGPNYSALEYQNNYAPIISNTSDTITMTRNYSAYDGTTSFKIVESNVTIDGLTAADEYPFFNKSESSLYIIAKGFNITGGAALNISNWGTLWLQGCNITRKSGEIYGISSNGFLIIDGCIVSGNYSQDCITINGGSQALIRGNVIRNLAAAGSGVSVDQNSFATLFNNTISTCKRGIYARGNSAIISNNLYVNTINNCTTAIESDSGGYIDAKTATGTGNTTANKASGSSAIRTNNGLVGDTQFSVTDIGGLIINTTTSAKHSLDSSDIYKTGTTTDATPIDLISIAVAANTSGWITYYVKAVSGNNTNVYKRTAFFERNTGGNVTLLADGADVPEYEDAAAWGCVAFADTANQTLDIVATGAAGTTIVWSGSAKYKIT